MPVGLGNAFDTLTRPLYTDVFTVAELGNSGWDWKGLQPYYKKVRQILTLDMVLD